MNVDVVVAGATSRRLKRSIFIAREPTIEYFIQIMKARTITKRMKMIEMRANEDDDDDIKFSWDRHR